MRSSPSSAAALPTPAAPAPAARPPTRPRRGAAAATRARRRGLPPPPGARGGGVVYAYLGQHHKLSAAVVERWASLLRAAPRARVLWLLDWPGSAARLRAAVAAAGVRASRLVFAPRRPLGEHLCAFALADIALDSPLYNSGATGIDLLWAGVPLISIPGALADGGGGGGSGGGGSSCRRGASGDWRCVGTIFQRNALSLAAAARQPHTVAHTWRGYDALAGAPAARPATRRELRRRAREARRDAPLFDTDRWAAHFEAARAHRGKRTPRAPGRCTSSSPKREFS